MDHSFTWIKIISVILILISHNFVSLAQESYPEIESYHLVVLNKKRKVIKKLTTDDKIRLQLKDGTRVKGNLTAIDSIQFTVNAHTVQPDQVEKVSIKNSWLQILGIPFVAFGGFLTFGALATGDIAEDELTQAGFLLGVPIAAVGVALVVPGYYQIGKRFIMITNKQDPLP